MRRMSSLESLFESRRLIRPSDDQPNIIHLVRALARLAGVTDLPHAKPVDELIALIGPASHLVFVLLDGLGMNIVHRLPRESFIARKLERELLATFPSTTACALTSVATGAYPAQHAVTGWFTYVPDLDMSVTMLPFAERFTKQSLAERGLTAEQLLPVPAFYPRMKSRQLTLLPKPIFNTPYARYSRGYTEGAGYDSLPHAINQVIAHVKENTESTYTHLYVPDVDTFCHHNGVAHPDVLTLVMKIDAELERLAAALGERARIVISADHGLIDTPPADQNFLMLGDPMLELLRVPPTGDGRMPIFHVRDNRHEEFAAMFHKRFESTALLATAEAEKMRLFGPENFSREAKRRFGDFIGIPFLATTLGYSPATAAPAHPYIGNHGGLSPQEMFVPMCVA